MRGRFLGVSPVGFTQNKICGMQCVAQAVNEVGGQQRSLKDVKKKGLT